jgi:hypothetical protein
MSYYVLELCPVEKFAGLRSDQTICFNGSKTKSLYRRDLHRISFLDTVPGKRLFLIINNFEIDAIVIAKIYKARWQIKLFFKWIKQNFLRLERKHCEDPNLDRYQHIPDGGYFQ